MNVIKNTMKNKTIDIEQKNGRIIVNGQEYKGSNVSVVNGQVYIDGTLAGEAAEKKGAHARDVIGSISIEIHGQVDSINIEGDVDNISVADGGRIGEIDSTGNVTVQGDVDGDIDCGGNVIVNGAVDGTIDSGGNVIVNGELYED